MRTRRRKFATPKCTASRKFTVACDAGEEFSKCPDCGAYEKIPVGSKVLAHRMSLTPERVVFLAKARRAAKRIPDTEKGDPNNQGANS